MATSKEWTDETTELVFFWPGALAAHERVGDRSDTPAKVVEQFIEAHLQGRFAESRTFTLERVNLSASPFSNWLFGSGSGDAPTADLFLSRKFAQAFRYTIIGTAATGDNQVTVAVLRASPNLAHMYTWALAPKRGATPYEILAAPEACLPKT